MDVAPFSQASQEALRDSIAEKFATIFVEKQLAEIRQAAIEAVRQALLPTVDAAMAEALAAVEHEDDLEWSQWLKIVADTTGENSVPVQ
jgi:hypothetical protein